MRFLIDANLPRAAIDVCQKFGHQVEFARDIGMAAAPDEQIAARACESGAALLTRDLDFSDVRRYPPDQYQGIVVLRPVPPLMTVRCSAIENEQLRLLVTTACYGI